MSKENHHACNKYATDARKPPSIQVHIAKIWSTKQAWRKLEDIVLRKANDRWVHHPHTDALVITARVTNSNVHCLMVDDGSVLDILYLNTYKKMDLTEDDLDPNSFTFYGFTGDHIVPRGVAKLTITVGEHPWTLTVPTNFLVVDAQLTINRIIRRLLPKPLKAASSIYHLTMKFPMAEGTSEVRCMIQGNTITSLFG